MGLLLFLFIKMLEENLDFLYTPSKIKDEKSLIGKKIRLGGMVQKDSVKKDETLKITEFAVTDYNDKIDVEYKGILPIFLKKRKV